MSQSVPFDRMAHSYTFSERVLFGKGLHRARLSLLHYVFPKNSRILILGEGNGRLLNAGIKKRPDIDWIYTDLSPAMKAVAEKRPGNECAHYFIHDWMKGPLQLGEKVDYVWVPFFFSCFDEKDLKIVIENLKPLLKPETKLLVVDFNDSKELVGWKKWRQIGLLKWLYFYFGIVAKISANQLCNYEKVLSKYELFPIGAPRVSKSGIWVTKTYGQ